MTDHRRVVFLPGAAGAADFWRPAGERLPAAWEKVYVSWPGMGDQPHDPSIAGFADLVDTLAGRLDRPSDLVAQSIGGAIAVAAAAALPDRVRRLVLVATSGGVDVARLGAADWRDDYRRAFPSAAGWVTTERPADQTAALRRLTAPTLLIWGDADPISPVAVGRHLACVIPRAVLRVIAGGDHDVAMNKSADVARLIACHLAADAQPA